ncbi:hypothetical protein DM02DRAFT_613827 [Periconia macrospinosa]|uniref:Uncharacterized protein n=1 Tax=Periconia macrospinosa TaxID=97972 RepID=A0A2V1DWK1_9PLEO|nr:hypothetical protein DM02DRAFT_613827 [Periconia macrospinosa]
MSDAATTNNTSKATDLLEQAIEVESTSKTDEALWQAANNLSPEDYEEFACSALRSAVRSGSSVIATHLINSEGVPISALTVLDIAHKPSIPLLETLVANGWDLNEASPKDNWRKGKRIIDKTVQDHELVVWLVEHGAAVNGGEEDYEFEPRPPLLTETCAVLGSVKTLKFLLSHNAKMGRRTLHCAAKEAAAMGADPSNASPSTNHETEEDSSGTRDRSNREEMLRFLVDDLKLNVNAMDSDAAKPYHFGTPLNYAVRQRNGAAVVRWLLQKGADPTLKGLDATMGPQEIARSNGFTDIVGAFADKSKS